MVNPALVNATNQTFFQLVKDSYLPALLERTKELVTAPYHYSDMLWIVVPLIVAD